MFAYCRNNPVNYSDPSGLCGICLANRNFDQFSASLFCDHGAGGGGGGAGSLYITYIATEAIVGGIITADDYIDELIDTIIDKLSKSLAKSGRKEYRNEFEEHHIAAKKAFNARRAASILEQVLPGGVENPLNKVMLKTSVHRRIHTNAYYLLVNYAIIMAYNSANGDPRKQTENMTSVLGALYEFLTGLNILSTN